MRGIIAAVSAATGMAASIMGAGVAHADQQSYLDAVGPIPFSAQLIAYYGDTACSTIRGGMSREQFDTGLNYIRLAKPDITEIAQRELCPDTLPH